MSRFVRDEGLSGVVHGRHKVALRVADRIHERPSDRLHRALNAPAPNHGWVADHNESSSLPASSTTDHVASFK